MNTNQTLKIILFNTDNCAQVERSFNCADCKMNQTCNGRESDCAYLIAADDLVPMLEYNRKGKDTVNVLMSADKYSFEKMRKETVWLTDQFKKSR